MLNRDFYPTIFKRKSFHVFLGCGSEKMTAEDIRGIEAAYAAAEPLCPDIRTAIRIVPHTEAALKRDAEYYVLLYSERKPNYLHNAGYLGEQLDLYMQEHNLACVWYGLGKPDLDTYEGLPFVIMFALRKVSDPQKYRKDMFKATRKPLEDIWTGDTLGIAEVARFAPSACNSQPWKAEVSDGVLTVARVKKPGKIGLLTPKAAFYFNRIDMGIFLCFLEICMAEKGISAARELFPDEEDAEFAKVAEYRLQTE